MSNEVIFLPIPEKIDFKSKHLRFEVIGYVLKGTRKTNNYEVLNKHDDFVLGTIEWFPKWRRYTFFPKEATCYEEECLRDIANFCIECTKKIKEN